MKKRIAINGFGRIGRLTAREILKRSDVELVAINDLTDTATLAHLFKYDSSHGSYSGSVSSDPTSITIDGQWISATALTDPTTLPWKDLQIDVVLECTGIFLTRDKAIAHIQAGAKRVVISAPAKDSSVETFVLGVNADQMDGSDDIISNASCTTNCLAPVIKIVDEQWGIQNCTMVTIHAFTQDQRLQDAPHKDLRRARAASVNIIPTSTGAASAVEKVYPAIKGKMFASSYRVPVISGSIIELYCVLNKQTTVDEVNAHFKQLSTGSLKGILDYQTDPLVSSDIIANRHSAIFDAPLTEVNGNILKIVAWYDNESGYSARLADMCEWIASKI